MFNLPFNYKKDLKEIGHFSINKLFEENEINIAKEGIINFLDKRNSPEFESVKIEYNYGKSELRLWNSQKIIPELSYIYKGLKKLNKFLFNDYRDFCMLTIVNSKCKQDFFDRRWHTDSFNKQRKFFLHLTNVSDKDGPFEFVPKTHKLRYKIFNSIRNSLLFYPYFKLNKFSLEPTYTQISDSYMKKIKNKIKYVCSKGDLLVADVRMLHRDSPCISGSRIALHCYLGAETSKFKNNDFKLN